MGAEVYLQQEQLVTVVESLLMSIHTSFSNACLGQRGEIRLERMEYYNLEQRYGDITLINPTGFPQPETLQLNVTYGNTIAVTVSWQVSYIVVLSCNQCTA